MFVVHKKGLKLDGSAPAILYAYGGFAIDTLPRFSPTRAYWLEHGGILAVANIRGGAEYGESWHEAAMTVNRQKCFDDFEAAAEYLVAHHYTSKERLASEGGSKGGLLVSTCYVQRPDLFGAVLCHVPVTDMLRYPRNLLLRYDTRAGHGGGETDHQSAQRNRRRLRISCQGIRVASLND
jgi:prolyl oligopeptidase